GGGGLRRLRLGAGVPGRLAAGATLGDPRGERAAGGGEPAGDEVDPARGGRLPPPGDRVAATAQRPGGGGAAAAVDRHSGPRRPPGRGPGTVRAAPGR